MGKKNRGKTNVNETKKIRLNKTTSGEFIGFAAFANTTTTIAPVAAAAAAVPLTNNHLPSSNTTTTTTSTTKQPSPNNNNNKSTSTTTTTLQPCPLFTGQSPLLTTLFKKIGQKRDAATKQRALNDLVSLYSSSSNNNNNSSSSPNNDNISKKDSVAALSHLCFLFTTKLAYDNDRHVRGGALRCLRVFKTVVPKAWRGLLSGRGVVVGYVWCLRCDPASEVSREAKGLVEDVIDVVVKESSGGVKAAARGDDTTTSKQSAAIPSNLRLSIVRHLNKTLGYARPSLLAEVYGGNSSSSSENNNNNNNDESSEERFERVMSAALLSTGDLLRAAPEQSSESSCFRYASHFDEGRVTRHVMGSRGSLRRGAYRVLAMAAEGAPSLLFDSDKNDDDDEDRKKKRQSSSLLTLSRLFRTAFDTEKDPSNHVALFEALLLCLKSSSSSTTTTLPEMDKLIKSVNKQLRKACYGAPAEDGWALFILPFVAVLLGMEKEEMAVGVVTALNDGQKSAVGSADTIAISSALAECAGYILLRTRSSNKTTTRPDDDDEDDAMLQQCLSLYLASLSVYLTLSSTRSYHVETLSKILVRCATTTTHSKGDDYLVPDWFFDDVDRGLVSTLLSCEKSQMWSVRITTLLRSCCQTTTTTTSLSNRLTTMTGRHIFEHVLSHHRRRSSSRRNLISIDDITLLSLLLTISSKQQQQGCYYLSSDSSIEKFVIDDLLQWVILAGVQQVQGSSQNDVVVVTTICFEILSNCLENMSSSSSSRLLWEAFFREMIAARCDVCVISKVLRVMSSSKETKEEGYFPMEVLNEYALSMAKQQQQHVITRGTGLMEESQREFYRVCLGLPATTTTTCRSSSDDSETVKQELMIITPSIISQWIDITCNNNNNNNNPPPSQTTILLRTLLSLAASSTSDNTTLSTSDTLRLTTRAWYIGGDSWSIDTVTLLSDSNNEALKDEWMTTSRTLLQNELRTRRNDDDDDDDSMKVQCQEWADRAWRRHLLINPNNDESFSLGDDVGLTNVELWQSCLDDEENKKSNGVVDGRCWLTQGLFEILKRCNTEEDRRRVIFTGRQKDDDDDDDAVSLMVAIVMTICQKRMVGSVEDLAESSSSRRMDSSKRRNNDVVSLVALMGGSDGLGDDFLKSCCLSIVRDYLPSLVVGDGGGDGRSYEMAQRGVSVIDDLTEILFGTIIIPPVVSSQQPPPIVEPDDIDPHAISLGDVLYYTTTSSSQQRDKVTVIKVHKDDYPNLYYTIRMDKDDNERQTIADRLKRHPSPPTSSSSSNDDDDDERRQVVSRILSSHLSPMQRPIAIALTQSIVSRYIQPLQQQPSSSNERDDALATLAEIIISRMGLVDDNATIGYGSVRHLMFGLVTSLSDAVIHHQNNSDDDDVVVVKKSRALRCLAMIMGFGRPPQRCCHFDILSGFDPWLSLEAGCRLIIQRYDEEEEEESDDATLFDTSFLMWVSVSIGQMRDERSIRQIVDAINRITQRRLVLRKRSGGGGDDERDVKEEDLSSSSTLDEYHGLLVMIIIDELSRLDDKQLITKHRSSIISPQQPTTPNDTNNHENDETTTTTTTTTIIQDQTFHLSNLTCLSHLISSFATTWSDKSHSSSSLPLPPWHDVFVDFLRRYNNNNSQEIHQLIATGARRSRSELCHALFHSVNKQWCAFQLLRVAAVAHGRYEADKEAEEEEDGVATTSLSPTTQRRIDELTTSLPTDEADEWHSDVETTCRFVPSRLVDELTSWDDSPEQHHHDDDDVWGDVTRLLGWIVFLDFMEGACSLSSSRYRGSLSSFAKLTGSVRVALDTALRFAQLEGGGMMMMTTGGAPAVRSDDDDDDVSTNRNGDRSLSRSFLENVISLSNINHDTDPHLPSKLATLVIFRTFENLPTLAKSWWNDSCPKPMRSVVCDFVRDIVAPETLRMELTKVNDNETNKGLGDMVVTGSCVSREVVATYVQDECQLSVTIRIPPTFPLRNVEVDCQKTHGIIEKQWRRWSLQIMRMLNNQDGHVLDALLLWKQNVDREFEGVEPCPVCYSVLCVKTHAMPNLECRTCANRFHSSCLYKWFGSSGKSQCVLCQQPWSGVKV